MSTSICKLRRIGILAGLTLCTAAAAVSARADVVTDWNATAEAVFVAKNAQSLSYFAMVHIAIYDAVNAVDGRYTVFAVKPTTPARGASREAAAAAAAYRTLLGLYPDQAAVLDPAYTASLAKIPNGVAKARGIRIGEEVAAAWLEMRADDGREANVPYEFGDGPGVYQRTPPAFPNPAMPWLAVVKPLALTSPAQFRAYGPPDLTSRRYAQDFEMTKRLGAANSAERTTDETETARFYTENPLTFFGRNVRELTAARRLPIIESARLMAMTFVSIADSMTACWDSKYHFNFWRPVTAIPAADIDDNPATEADPSWMPLANTPPHPEYPAGHGCLSTALAESLRFYFRTSRVRVTLTSTVPGTVPHVFRDTRDMIEEVKMARVFGGMHFLTSVEHGTLIGQDVARWVARHHFKPVRGRR